MNTFKSIYLTSFMHQHSIYTLIHSISHVINWWKVIDSNEHEHRQLYTEIRNHEDAEQFMGHIVVFISKSSFYSVKDEIYYHRGHEVYGLVGEQAEVWGGGGVGPDMWLYIRPGVETRQCHHPLNDNNLRDAHMQMRVATVEEVRNITSMLKKGCLMLDYNCALGAWGWRRPSWIRKIHKVEG